MAGFENAAEESEHDPAESFGRLPMKFYELRGVIHDVVHVACGLDT
jgi:hypothetical protein